MSVNLLSAVEAIERMRIPLGQPGGFDTIIDARSEDEYALDHLPHAVNWPSLNNAERITVGSMYKQLGDLKRKSMVLLWLLPIFLNTYKAIYWIYLETGNL